MCDADSDVEVSSVQYIYGKGMGSLVHELATNGVNTVHRFRHEDQAGSLIGVTDEDGLRTDEYFYLDFGTPIHRPIAFDGNTSRISSIAANTPVFGVTRITLTGVSLTADVFNGKQLRAIGSLHIGEVYDTGTSTIEVYDLDDQIYDAIDNGAGFVVLDFTSPWPAAKDQGTWDDVIYMGGPNETVFVDNSASFLSTVDVGDLVLLRGLTLPAEWVAIDEVRSNGELVIYSGDYSALSAPGQPYEVQPPSHWTYDGGSDTSTYTNSNAGFEDYMVGWLFTPNVHKPAYLQVVAVDDTAGEITVKGDARGLEITPVDDWRIHAPPGVDAGTGALHTDLTETGPRYLCAQMRYMPPQVGFDVMGTIEGRQLGSSLFGLYVRASGLMYDAALAIGIVPEDILKAQWGSSTSSSYRKLIGRKHIPPQWRRLGGPCCWVVHGPDYEITDSDGVSDNPDGGVTVTPFRDPKSNLEYVKFRMTAEFLEAPPFWACRCCEFRQLIKIDNANGPPHDGFDESELGRFVEDRSDTANGKGSYGHRDEPGGVKNSYGNGPGPGAPPNMAGGCFYYGEDAPKVPEGDRKKHPGMKWTFVGIVIDTCCGGIVATSPPLTIHWGATDLRRR